MSGLWECGFDLGDWVQVLPSYYDAGDLTKSQPGKIIDITYEYDNLFITVDFGDDAVGVYHSWMISLLEKGKIKNNCQCGANYTEFKNHHLSFCPEFK